MDSKINATFYVNSLSTTGHASTMFFCTLQLAKQNRHWFCKFLPGLLFDTTSKATCYCLENFLIYVQFLAKLYFTDHVLLLRHAGKFGIKMFMLFCETQCLGITWLLYFQRRRQARIYDPL